MSEWLTPTPSHIADTLYSIENQKLKLRQRAIDILEEVKTCIPGYSENQTPLNSKCDYEKLRILCEEITCETYLFYFSEEELDCYIQIADKILTRIRFLKEGSELSFSVIDTILDAIWHQKKTAELSNKTRREIAKLALAILNPEFDSHWVNNLAPSASSYNHCIYFIFMLEDRFRTENEEFEAVYNHLTKYIERYGYDHHLSQRWTKRLEDIKSKSC